MPRRRANRAGKPREENRAALNFHLGYRIVDAHPIFGPLLTRATVIRDERSRCPQSGWAVVTSNGVVHAHPARLAAPEEWAYVIAHCLLHLGFGHFQPDRREGEWALACDVYVAKFLATLKLGRAPEGVYVPPELTVTSEQRLYDRLCDRDLHLPDVRAGVGGSACDMVFEPIRVDWTGARPDWQAAFGEGLALAVLSAVDVAAGVAPRLSASRRRLSAAERARGWFVSSYPLLGALASSFEIVEDALVCSRLDVSIAAVDERSKEIFVNPAAGLGEQEARFVLAHELLHVGLRHASRRRGRDPYLWNVACDYVINGWLVAMDVGELPSVGLLYDPELAGESAESVYDRIATDLRRARKLATFRGTGLGDILERGDSKAPAPGAGVDLDAFYRDCLAHGLSYHEAGGRGYLPSGLVEEIRALGQPPIPWDVELARWFDEHFRPVERRRTYARPSRRQAATPDLPRPRWVPNPRDFDGRTFGVVLDTSGSMDRVLLAKALGAIASYSMSRDVPAVRVVFCDAHPYDQGYMAPDEIAGRVKVRGRGGTVLQPGIDLLETAEDFPDAGPILIITDGACDRVRVRRDHAFLTPEAAALPFTPKGPVFRIR